MTWPVAPLDMAQFLLNCFFLGWVAAKDGSMPDFVVYCHDNVYTTKLLYAAGQWSNVWRFARIAEALYSSGSSSSMMDGINDRRYGHGGGYILNCTSTPVDGLV